MCRDAPSALSFVYGGLSYVKLPRFVDNYKSYQFNIFTISLNLTRFGKSPLRFSLR